MNQDHRHQVPQGLELALEGMWLAPGTDTGTGTVTGTGTSTVAKWERYVFILLIHHLIIKAWLQGGYHNFHSNYWWRYVLKYIAWQSLICNCTGRVCRAWTMHGKINRHFQKYWGVNIAVMSLFVMHVFQHKNVSNTFKLKEFWRHI